MTDRDGTANGGPGRFDPRFDPAFQPGYDARNDPAIAARGRSFEASRPAAGQVQAPVGSRTSASPSSGLPTRSPVSSPAARSRSGERPGEGRPSGSADRRAADRGDDRSDNRSDDRSDDRSDSNFDDDRFDDDRDREADAPSAGRNPFLLALWVLSAVFVLGGIALLQALPMLNERAQSGTGIDSIYLFLQAALYGAPMLVVLGLAVAAGTLFLHASRWPRRENRR